MSFTKRIILFTAFIFVMIGLLVWSDRHDGVARARAEAERKSVEDTATVQPPLRDIAIEDGRVLGCFTFPIRAYDNTLLKCVACREDSTEFGPKKPLTLACTR